MNKKTYPFIVFSFLRRAEHLRLIPKIKPHSKFQLVSESARGMARANYRSLRAHVLPFYSADQDQEPPSSLH